MEITICFEITTKYIFKIYNFEGHLKFNNNFFSNYLEPEIY